MNTSNKTLLQILVEELPNHGGWPCGCHAITQDSDKAINTYDSADGLETNEYGTWRWLESWIDYCITAEDAPCLASDYATAIITREQYESAMAANKELRHYQVSTEHYTPDVSAGKTVESTGSNGWIDWHGGECPVDSDAIVEVKYRKPSPLLFNNDRAGDFTWSHDGCSGDIIAYRLVNKHELDTACIDVKRDAVKPSDAQLEADLNDCIGQPQEDIKTIRAEMLAVLNDTRLTMNLRAAMKLVDAFIDAGYRKQ